MTIIEYTTVVAAKPPEVFDFLAQPRNLIKIMPTSPKIEFLQVPDRLFLGATFSVRVSKLCFHSTSTSEVTWFEEGRGFTDTQRKGPFGRFEHRHTVDVHAQGSVMVDRIEAEPPTGWWGMLINERRLRREFSRMFSFRERRLHELFPHRGAAT